MIKQTRDAEPRPGAEEDRPVYHDLLAARAQGWWLSILNVGSCLTGSDLVEGLAKCECE
jgi:hypothetical protein